MTTESGPGSRGSGSSGSRGSPSSCEVRRVRSDPGRPARTPRPGEDILNESLRRELLGMARLDDETRAELAATGELFDAGYEPRMARVHERNARRLRRIIQSVGWPGTDLVGPDGAEAAWLVLQHAIAEPELLRRTLPLLEAAARSGVADPAHAALLEDRIRFFEGRPQRFGTQFDWDAEGHLSPGEVEEPERLDDRRRAAGLPPLGEQMQEARDRARAEGDCAPVDHKAYVNARDAWAEQVGWRTR